VNDLYALLGVSRQASAREIVDGYRKAVLACHPDRTGGHDSERFRQVQEAYEILSDPVRRRDYDRRRGIEVPVRIVEQPVPSPSSSPIREIRRVSRPAFDSTSSGDPWEELFEFLWRSIHSR